MDSYSLITRGLGGKRPTPSGVTVEDVQFSDFGNTTGVGASPADTFTVPAGCNLAVFLMVDGYREGTGAYTTPVITLGGAAVPVVAETGSPDGFQPVAYIAAQADPAPGAQTLVVDRPGTSNSGSLHVVAYFLSGADTNAANWSHSVDISTSATSLTNNITAPASGSVLLSHAGPRRPGDIGGCAGINYTSLPTIDGCDDTPTSDAIDGASLGTKWASRRNAAAGSYVITPTWPASVRAALCSIAIGPA